MIWTDFYSNFSWNTISKWQFWWANTFKTTAIVDAHCIDMTATVVIKTFIDINTSEEVWWINTWEKWCNESSAGAIQSIVFDGISTITRVSGSTSTWVGTINIATSTTESRINTMVVTSITFVFVTAFELSISATSSWLRSNLFKIFLKFQIDFFQKYHHINVKLFTWSIANTCQLSLVIPAGARPPCDVWSPLWASAGIATSDRPGMRISYPGKHVQE